MVRERKRELVGKIEDIFDASLIDESIKNTKAFNIYINNYYDLELLGQFPIWFAQYDKLPSFPYHYEYLQYSESGEIDGVKGKADLNICFIPNK